jgi:diacylglycerol kinase
VAAVVIGAWLRLDPTEWAILATIIALVLILEGLNAALELAVDLASPTLHPKAKAAKDVAAGMVLVAALASIAVGAALFGSNL